jgi:small-conductance mechanosensitive channel
LRGSVQNELQFRIVEVCREHDIELAFPQRDIWIRNAEDLRPTLDAETEAPARSEKKPNSTAERGGD